MMAVETFVYLYIIGFALAVFMSVLLLVTAARALGREERVRNRRDDREH